MEEIKPFFEDATCICFSSDDNYSIYLYVAINSLIKNSNDKNNYEIYILDDGISNYRKEEILKLSKENIYICFINIKDYLSYIIKNKFYITSHFSIASYYRFFIPRIFKNFEKIIYLDSDIVILDDIFKLKNLDISDKLIAACLDQIIVNQCLKEDNDSIYIQDYLKNKLKLKDIYKYIQAGVLIMNIKRLKDFNFEVKCLNKLEEIKTPIHVDQDIINSVLDKENIFYLDLSWNVGWHFVFNKEFNIEKQNNNKHEYIEEYIRAYDNPKIMHFASEIKPWLFDKEGSKYFWEYAYGTPFYNELLIKKEFNILNNEINNLKDQILYIKNNKLDKMSIIDYLFSITEDNRYKYIIILGIKITIKK